MTGRRTRGSGVIRYAGLAAGLVIASALCAANTLTVIYDGDVLRPVSPGIHFLTGKALDQLRDARTVVFISRLSLYTIDRSIPFREVPERFVVSYDIWEEKFKVTIPGVNPRTRVGMTASQAEAWCLENLAISAAGLPPDRPFFLRLEMRSADVRELSQVINDPGISLRAFLELLSRKAGPDDQRWGPYETGRLRLSDLTRVPGRGTRTG